MRLINNRPLSPNFGEDPKTGGEGGIRTPTLLDDQTGREATSIASVTICKSISCETMVVELKASISQFPNLENVSPPQIAPQRYDASIQMLAKVVRGWVALPPQIQQAIVSIVQNSADTKGTNFEM